MAGGGGACNLLNEPHSLPPFLISFLADRSGCVKKKVGKEMEQELAAVTSAPLIKLSGSSITPGGDGVAYFAPSSTLVSPEEDSSP